MDEGNEDYNLVLFGIAESFPEGLPPMKDIITYVEGRGTRIPGALSFPPGYVVDFFQIVKDRIDMDLLPVVGGICFENPEEEYLAAGALAFEDVQKAVDKLKSLLISKEGMMAFEQAAAKKRLDARWAIQTLKDLLRVLLHGTALTPKPALLIGIFE